MLLQQKQHLYMEPGCAAWILEEEEEEEELEREREDSPQGGLRVVYMNRKIYSRLAWLASKYCCPIFTTRRKEGKKDRISWQQLQQSCSLFVRFGFTLQLPVLDDRLHGSCWKQSPHTSTQFRIFHKPTAHSDFFKKKDVSDDSQCKMQNLILQTLSRFSGLKRFFTILRRYTRFLVVLPIPFFFSSGQARSLERHNGCWDFR